VRPGWGWIKKRPDRRRKPWQAGYTGPDHRQHTQHFAKKAEAERWLDEQYAKVVRREWADPNLAEELLSSAYARSLVRAEQTGKPSPATLAKWNSVWRLHVAPALGDRPIGRIERADVEDLVKALERRVSSYQAAEAHKIVQRLLARAVDEGALTRNVAARIKITPPTPTPRQVFDPASLDAVLEHLPERFRVLTLLGAYGCLRWEEVVGLKRDAIDLDQRSMRIFRTLGEVQGHWHWKPPKTDRSHRTIPLPDVCIKPLAEHMLRFPPIAEHEDERFVGVIFTGDKGGPVRRHVYRAALRAACAAAGVPYVRPRWLRHTGGSLTYAATKDIKAAADRMGNSVAVAEKIYVQGYPDAARAAADAIDALVLASRSSAKRLR
jgi:integrase